MSGELPPMTPSHWPPNSSVSKKHPPVQGSITPTEMQASTATRNPDGVSRPRPSCSLSLPVAPPPNSHGAPCQSCSGDPAIESEARIPAREADLSSQPRIIGRRGSGRRRGVKLLNRKKGGGGVLRWGDSTLFRSHSTVRFSF